MPGIRAVLMLLVLILTVPVALFVAWALFQGFENDRAHSLRILQDTARLTAAHLDDHLGNVDMALTTLSEGVAGHLDEPGATARLLARMRPALTGQTASLAVWRADGTLVSSLDPAVTVTLQRVPHRAYFRDVVRTGEPGIEAPVRSGVTGRWIALMGRPVREAGRVTGVVAAATELAQLQAVTETHRSLPEGAVVTLVDAHGVVLARSLEPGPWIGRQMLPDTAQLARLRAARFGADAHIKGFDGQVRMMGYAAVRGAPWLVFVGVPAKAALAPARLRLWQSAVLGTLTLTVALAVAAWLARRMTHPLLRLSTAARAVGRGEAVQVDPARTGPAEVRELADTFARMYDDLRQRTGAQREGERMLRELTAHLARSEERLSLAMESSDLGLFDWHLGEGTLYMNGQAAALRGCPADEATTRPEAVLEWVHPEDLEMLRAALSAALKGTAPALRCEYRVQRVDGTWRWVLSRGRVVERDGNGRALRLAGTHVDVTERHELEERLRRLADHDPLTGLPNRRLFHDRLDGALRRAARHQRPLALVFLDIDHFKDVNDTLGHEAGDHLLRSFARRLVDSVRAADAVARLAGDEFTVIMEDFNDVASLERVAQHLVASLRHDADVGEGRTWPVRSSVGVALVGAADLRHPALTGDRLLKLADTALYRAKRLGKDRCCVLMFDPTLPL